MSSFITTARGRATFQLRAMHSDTSLRNRYGWPARAKRILSDQAAQMDFNVKTAQDGVDAPTAQSIYSAYKQCV